MFTNEWGRGENQDENTDLEDETLTSATPADTCHSWSMAESISKSSQAMTSVLPSNSSRKRLYSKLLLTRAYLILIDRILTSSSSSKEDEITCSQEHEALIHEKANLHLIRLKRSKKAVVLLLLSSALSASIRATWLWASLSWYRGSSRCNRHTGATSKRGNL
jgi:hypothetical protein